MKPALVLALAAVLAACATLKPEAAPGCHGPRRPANPNGSVLGGDQAPEVPMSPAGCGRPLS